MPTDAQQEEAFTGGLIQGPSFEKKRTSVVQKSLRKRIEEEYMPLEDRISRDKGRKKTWKVIIALIIAVIVMIVLYNIIF
jgi:hypothetical protein